MGLTKYKLGDLIELCDERNYDGQYSLNDIRGISTEKEFIDTKANMDGVSLSSYKIVKIGEFAYVADTSRRGDKIALAFNREDKPVLISSIYTVFRIARTDLLLANYLFILFDRPEFDRYARFNSWGSARETFDWDTMCDMDIELPDITIQQKYVDIYEAMLQNQQSYERGLEDLRLACDGFIEELRREIGDRKIGPFIRYRNNRNTDKTISRVMGLSTQKAFREAQSRVNRDELGNYKIVSSRQFAFVPTTDTWKVLAFALNEGDSDVVVSPIYEVFSVNEKELIPEYLAIWLSRREFDRYARYHSWGSARENFSWEEMCSVEIPIPDIKVQQAVAELFAAYNTRKKINEQLKAQLKNICPVLIKGSLEEGAKS